MTIKEVEQKLELPRATIWFYEKEGLINPKRNGNSYREYNDEDITLLKKIVILRKIGLSVSDIEDFLNEDTSLHELLERNISDLQKKMIDLEGAIRVCKKMQNNVKDSNNFDEEYYWEEIHTEEAAGNKFFELVNDIVTYEKYVILKEFGLINNEGQFLYGTKESIFRALSTCVMTGFLYFFLEDMKLDAFIEGFLVPFSFIIIYSIFNLPLYFLGKKHPKLAKTIKHVGIGIGIAFVSIIILCSLFGS